MDNKNQEKLNFVKNNIIFIHGDFDQDISINVLPEFDQLIEAEKNKKQGKIILDIASNGGVTYYLKCLLARVEKAKKENVIIETKVFSHAYSCGSMLACSGTEGYRFVSDFAEHLCHLGSGGLRANNDKELERGSDRLKAHFNFVRDMYKKYAKIPNLTQVIKDDGLFVRGKKIIEWGLADELY